MKKVISLVLVVSMVLSSMSFAFAGTFTDVTGDYTDAVEALTALDIIDGYGDGTFRPENSITRAELAKVLVEALGYGDLVVGAESSFSDTATSWADGYIAVAAGTGLVNGYGDGTFGPDKTVTYNEAFTMVVRALGYTDESLTGTWPTNYKVKAINLDLDDDLVMDGTEADRGGIAQIIFNALEANLVTIDSDNDVNIEQTSDGEDKILLDQIAELDDDYDVTTSTLDEDYDDYGGDIIDLEPYLYQNLEVYLNDDDEVVYIKDNNSVVVTGTIDDVDTDDEEIDIEDEDGDIQSIPYSDVDIDIYYNGEETSDYTLEDIATDYDDGDINVDSITIVGDDSESENDDIDDEDEIIGVIVWIQSQADLIENAYKTDRDYIDDIDLPVDDDDDVELDNITVVGDATSLEDIEEDDVVVAYRSYDDEDDFIIKLVVTRDTVEGEITRLGDGETYVDGVSYDISDTEGAIDEDDIDLGDEGTFYLDQDGQIVDYDVTSTSPTDYAIVMGTDDGEIDEESFDEYSIDDDNYPQIKLATQDDETVIYDVYVEIDEDDASIDDDEVATVDDDDDTDTDDEVLIYSDVDDLALYFNIDLEDGDIIQYSLNDDGQIDDITIVDYNYGDFDTTSSSFDLADGAVVFDMGDDDYEVVSTSDLEDDIYDSYVVYNDDGEVELVFTADVDNDDDTVYAYIEDIYAAYDSDDDEVQAGTIYYAGESYDVYTDDDDVLDGDDSLYEIEFDGDEITSSTAIDTDDLTEGVVDDTNTSSDKIKIDGTWYSLADDATMLGKDSDGDVEFIDLYDIDDDDTIYFAISADDDSEIGLIIVESYLDN
jgi:hypothetical protein